MRLDRDSKQPIWLGLILIFAAFIFTVFFITSVRADDEVSEPPHDPQYNNLVFITVSDKMYIGGDTVIDFYSGSSDGANAIVWKSNFSSNLSGFFQYVPKDQCFFIIASDGASAGHLNSIREVLSDLGASYWSGEQDGFWNPDHDLSGYEDQRAPFGFYNVRYMSRLVKYLPASPTPTSAPEVFDTYSFYIKPGSYGNFLLFDVKVHRSNIVKTPNSNNAVNYVRNLYERYDDLIFTQNALILRQGYYGGSFPSGFPTMQLYVPISDLNFEVDIYNAGSDFIGSFDYIRENYTKTTYNSIVTASNNSVYINTLTADNGYVICVGYKLGNYNGFVQFGTDNVFYKGDGIEQYYQYDSSTDYSSVGFNFSSSNDNSINASSWRWAIEYMTGITAMPTPSPDPNAPSPTPSPTEPPHVIINWPSGTPTPTPPFSVPVEVPGGGSGSPGGSSQGSLTPGQVNSTLNTFKQYTQNNGAFAFLYACTGLIPDEALFFLFILLFILLLLACLRLFVHFTGG